MDPAKIIRDAKISLELLQQMREMSTDMYLVPQIRHLEALQSQIAKEAGNETA